MSGQFYYACHDVLNARKRIKAVAALFDKEGDGATSAHARQIANDLAKLEAKLQRLTSRQR